ncbi:MAG: type II toxin-antitoxin system HicA family toxin [Methanomicrobiales archaeon]|nr:type II toxin-antitoxin system HicA family toxin [Methanomicrobiales archaeon]
MPKLPRADGEAHIAAFRRAGWRVNHIEGSHHILVKEGSSVHHSIPVHTGKDLGILLLRKFIEKSGLSPEDYCTFFSRKK